MARVTGGKVRVHVAVGAADRALVDVASSGAALSGYVSRDQINVYAAVPFALNGVLFPPSSAALAWREGFEDGVSVTMETPEDVLVKNPPLTAKRPCAEVSLDSGTRLSPQKVAFGTEYGDSHIIQAGRTLEVFSDPAHPADIQLVLRDDIYASAFASSGAFSRIGAQVNSVFVAGWVRTNNLGDAWYGGMSSPTGFGRSGIGVVRKAPLRTVICAADVPLVAGTGEERTTVGHILSGTPIEVIADGAPFVTLQLVNRDIHPGLSSTFLARTTDLASCPALRP